MTVSSEQLTDVLTKLVRPSICTEPGNTFVAGDFSGIELRVLHWLVGDEPTLQIIREHGSKRVYLDMASAIFGEQIEKSDTFRYTIGKIAVLALGYQGAENAFIAMAASYGVDVDSSLASKTIKAYRTKNKLVKNAWGAVDRRITAVVRDGGYMTWRNIRFGFIDGALVITLPSERRLYYQGAHIGQGKYGDEVRYYGDKEGRWQMLKMYGGLTIENIVQAISRCILVESMVEITSKAWEIVSHCYDENVVECAIGDAKQCAIDMTAAMTRSPRWAPNLPLTLDLWTGRRYRK